MKDLETTVIQDLDGEVWLPIEGYNNKYYVSNLGRVKSLKGKTEYLKTQQVNQKGYYRVELWNNGKRATLSVARLVGLAFIPNDDPINKTTIHHIDSNKARNTIENLQWLSLQDNIKEHYKEKEKTASRKNCRQA